jgi:hypothetical protein
MNIALQEIKKVVIEVGENNIVHIITDNGSNYKNAHRYVTNEYRHIAWQPCLAHTMNIMLKTIGDFHDHESVIDSAKLISRWLYNHGRLHTMMKNVIGGNLVRWNATQFGTNDLFLESFLRRKDCFMQWMATPELQKSGYLDSNAGRYAYACLSNLPWWDNPKRIVDSVQPLYVFLRFTDQQRILNFSDVLFNHCMHDIANDTYMNAGKMN